MDWILEHAELVVMAFQAVVLFIVWLLHRSFASTDDVEAKINALKVETGATAKSLADDIKVLEAAHGRAAGQIALLTDKVAGNPTTEDLADIKLSISNLEGDYKAISANVGNMDKHITSIGRSVDRIEGWLMEGKR
jgi:hypothetical protein